MDNEEINLKELITLLLNKKVIIIIISIITLVLGWLYTFFLKDQEYTATAMIVFGRVEGYIPQEGESQLLSEIQFNSSIINIYKNYMLSNEILNKAIQNSGEEIELADLKENLEVTAESGMISVIVNSANENVAIKISNEIVKVFLENARDFYQINHAYSVSEADESSVETESSHIIDLLISLVLGVVISCGGILVGYFMNSKIKNENDIETKLKMPLISKLNLLTDVKDEIVENTENSEQFKILRANVEFSIKDIKNNKTIFVTSINENDGKTFVSANLALSFSEIGKKVLIIDTDKKDGNVDKIFNTSNIFGLSNYLVDLNKISDKEKVEENKLIQHTKFDNLDVITIGNIKGSKFKIIQNDKLIKLINELKEKYDVIIVDGLEMLKYGDSRFLSNLCDQTLLIASLNKTKEEDLIKAKKEIEKVKGNLLGVILNRTQK